MFDLPGTPARDERLVIDETDHTPPWNEIIRKTPAWLDRYLGPAK